MSFQSENGEEEIQPQISPEEFLAERKRVIRNRSWWAIGIGAAIVVFHLLAFFVVFLLQEQLRAQAPEQFDGEFSWKWLFRSILFILGLFFIVGGIWGLREAKRLTIQDLIPSPEAVEFLRESHTVTTYFSYILVGCLILVTLFQLNVGIEQSVEIAGLVKPLVLSQNEYWRLLTYSTLHGLVLFGVFPLHLYFNGQALYGFGSLIEVLSNRAHLAIVFLLSVIGGGLLSLFFMPEVTSIGASGGIMGLVGYLAIYGHRRKRQLPPDFLKSVLVNIGFIAAFGLIAYRFVDNFGHLGGLLTGAIYGFLQIPGDLNKDPRKAGAAAEALGLICLGVFIFISVLTIFLLLGTIKF